MTITLRTTPHTHTKSRMSTILPFYWNEIRPPRIYNFFFLNNTPPTEISTLSLHDALPISSEIARGGLIGIAAPRTAKHQDAGPPRGAGRGIEMPDQAGFAHVHARTRLGRAFLCRVRRLGADRRPDAWRFGGRLSR